MVYFPVPTSTDDRSAKSLVPVRLRNVMLAPTSGGSRRGRGFAIVPRPGLVARVTPATGGNLRGLFCEPGFQSSTLFAVCGENLYSIAADWSATNKGAIPGGNAVLMETLSSSLGIVANGSIFEYDGATLTQATDADAPAPAETFAVFGSRAVSSQRDTDILAWSAVVDMLTWPALGFASAELRSDPIVGTVVNGTLLFAFGTVTTQVFNAIGGPDEVAISIDPTYRREVGLLSRDAMSAIDESVFFIGQDREGNRAPYIMAAATPRRLDNPALAARLSDLTDGQVRTLRTFAVGWRDKKLWIVRMPEGPSLAYDVSTGTWSEWTTFEAETLNMGFASPFGGSIVVGSPDDDALYTFEESAFDDAGVPIERVIGFHVPVDGPTPIHSVTLDIKCHGQALGTTPKALVRYYFDGGSLDSVTEWNDERIVDLPAAGDYGIPAPETRFGLARGPSGFLVEIRITDPVGFALFGVWVNEYPE